MLYSHINNIKIKGISVAVPTRKVPIESYNDIFGEDSVAKFTEMTGVKRVHRAAPQQTAADLAFEAAKDLLEKSGVDPLEIAQLLFVTQKPDYRSPATAFLLHRRLELPSSCDCSDINLACSGFIYALHSAMAGMQHSKGKYTLVLTGDTSVRSIGPLDRSMVMLFGDSGTAVLLEKGDVINDSHFAFRTDGSRFKAIITPAGAYRNIGLPLAAEVWGDDIERSDYDTHMKGMDVFGFSITDVPKLMKELMNQINTTADNYDYFALHQANMYILKQISRKIKIPAEKLPIALDRFGNNSSNSVPLVLADHFGHDDGREIRIFMSGFGAGLSWACCDTTINTSGINPIIFTDKFQQ